MNVNMVIRVERKLRVHHVETQPRANLLAPSVKKFNDAGGHPVRSSVNELFEVLGSAVLGALVGVVIIEGVVDSGDEVVGVIANAGTQLSVGYLEIEYVNRQILDKVWISH